MWTQNMSKDLHFGKLKAVGEGKRVPGSKGSRQYLICICECGTKAEYRLDALKSGKTSRCRPCSRQDQAVKMLRHGGSRKTGKSPEYRSWDGMIQRATNPKHKAFADYGGRGICVAKEWRSFENFLRDMGECPPGHTLERIDNSKGYSKENCRWATRKEQQNNRRNNRVFTFDGVTLTATQWAEKYGTDWNTVRGRIARGWEHHEAFSGRRTTAHDWELF